MPAAVSCFVDAGQNGFVLCHNRSWQLQVGRAGGRGRLHLHLQCTASKPRVCSHQGRSALNHGQQTRTPTLRDHTL